MLLIVWCMRMWWKWCCACTKCIAASHMTSHTLVMLVEPLLLLIVAVPYSCKATQCISARWLQGCLLWEFELLVMAMWKVLQPVCWAFNMTIRCMRTAQDSWFGHGPVRPYCCILCSRCGYNLTGITHLMISCQYGQISRCPYHLGIWAPGSPGAGEEADGLDSFARHAK